MLQTIPCFGSLWGSCGGGFWTISGGVMICATWE
jgi:hypothetical protein